MMNLELDVALLKNRIKMERKECFFEGLLVGIFLGLFLIPPLIHWLGFTHPLP